MFVLFPYKDDNQARKFPWFTWVIITANLWVFFAWQFSLPPSEQAAYFSNFAFLPVTFFGQLGFEETGDVIWEWATVFTSMFSHGGVAHVLGNMLFLYLYGDNVEDAMGKVRFFLFYLTCGLLAAVSQGLVDPSSNVPMVGASGAISGVIAGYLLLYPRANVRVFYWFIIFVGTVMVPAYLVLGIWVIEQILAFPASMSDGGGVAIAAHLGGFAAGIVLTPFFKKKNVKFFQAGRTRAFSRQGRRIR